MSATATLEIMAIEAGAAPELRALAARAFADPWSEASFASELAQPTTLALGLRETSGGGPGLLAFALFRAIGEEAELVLIATDPDVQNHGHGRALCLAGVEALRARGVQELFLEVAEGNAPARALYGALGFEEVGRRERYYRSGDDALLMRRAI